MGGNSYNATIAQIGQLAIITRQTPNHCIRNIFFFQSWSLLTKTAVILPTTYTDILYQTS
jgi:hypothetical protein